MLHYGKPSDDVESDVLRILFIQQLLSLPAATKTLDLPATQIIFLALGCYVIL